MARPLLDSEYLYGFHDRGGEQVMLDAGVPGWVLVTESIGDDPNSTRFGDYRGLSDRSLGVIVRLNNGYNPAGAIPNSSRYPQFASRCAAFVRNSPGCRIWIIGNEMNHPIERPGGEGGEAITPELYARCYGLCRDAIHKVDPDSQVLVGGVAPWNAATRYAGNPSGDWVQYFADILKLLKGCDGFTLHTYTHGDDPGLITNEQKLDSFPKYHYQFRAYRDFLGVVPASMRQLPCYITESDQGDVGGVSFPWTNRNTGWVRRAYAEINEWNQNTSNQLIRALILYRWSQDDGWYIKGKEGVLDDLRQAMEPRYRAARAAVQPDADLSKQVAALEAKIEAIKAALGRLTEFLPAVSTLKKETEDLTRGVSQVAAVQAEIQQVSEGIAGLEARLVVPGRVTQPRLQDVVGDLPSHTTLSYQTRSAAAIRRVIVHHTVTAADVKPERIAQAQVGQGKAGITYHFLVSGDGTIYRTQPLEAVTDQTLQAAANADGVGVALAGNFTAAVPPASQMESAAKLIAWLLDQLGLTTAAVVGRNEIDTKVGSPGAQWLTGEAYKTTLLAAVTKILTTPEDKDALIAQLRQQNQDLQAEAARLTALAGQVAPLQQQVKELQATVEQQRQEIERLNKALQAVGAGQVRRPDVLDVVDTLPKHPTLTYSKRTHAITTIAIHHSTGGRDLLVKNLALYHIQTNGWPGIAYHYVIAADGTIYWTNRHETRSYHASDANDYSLGICLIGNFMPTEPAGNQTPTPAQMRSTAKLAAWLMQELKVPLENVKGHREVDKSECPGNLFLAGPTWKNLLHASIRAVQAGREPGGQIEHYLLFWDHGSQSQIPGGGWAEADWRNAQEYISHFRPTTGFSVDDAMLARHVTIVGGEAGISGGDEARLVAAGAEVHRLAGADEADTRAKLAELIRNETPWPGAPAPVRRVPEKRTARGRKLDPWTMPPGWEPAAERTASRRRSPRRKAKA